MSTTVDAAPSPSDSWPALTTRHLDVIRTGIGSDRAVAEMLGVSPSQITRWRKGQVPDPLNADRLGALALVVEMLGRWLGADVIEEWLEGPNAHLSDRTPVYVLGQGRVADVIAAVEAMKAGVFA